jgi:hypothetical protein
VRRSTKHHELQCKFLSYRLPTKYACALCPITEVESYDSSVVAKLAEMNFAAWAAAISMGTND